jgi:thiol-disulfide isomerase/thioredoxin
VVFGASCCQACHAELSQIAALYSTWKEVGAEVLFISLDESKEDFQLFLYRLPFPAFSDFKKWESPAAIFYHVFATPTIYLLDAQRTILLRPHSVNQLNAWFDWFLIKQEK